MASAHSASQRDAGRRTASMINAGKVAHTASPAAPGARAATFTVAGAVRRGLTEAGHIANHAIDGAYVHVITEPVA